MQKTYRQENSSPSEASPSKGERLMIIVCPECSTTFNVDSDRIPGGSARVRCARCQHVFLVEKSLEPEVPEVEESVAFTEEATSDSTEQPPQDNNVNDQPVDDPDFSYDKFQELDTETAEEETFTFGAETKTEDENFTFSEAPEEADSTIEQVLATQEETPIQTEAAAKEDVPPQPVAAVEPPSEPEVTEQPEQKAKSGPVSSIIRMLLLLIIGILIIGGVFVYINGPDKLNQTIQQIFGQQMNRPVQTGQITLSDLEGKFIKNEYDGDLFLIHGEAINNFSQPRAAIQVKGVIFDQNGKPLLQKTVFCGNPISLEEIKNLSFVELEKIMGNQFGKDLSNMKIESKKTIPFDIVFKDLPQNLSEFSVKVTSSEAVTK